MDFKQLRFQITARICVLSLSIFILVQLENANAITLLMIAALVVVQVISLIRFVDHNNRQIEEFFETIKEGKKQSGTKSDNAFAAYLHTQLESLRNNLLKPESATDAQKQYLSTIVQHVGIGLITFDEHGEIQIMNIAAKNLLKSMAIKNIDELEPISNELVKCFRELKTGGRSLITIEIDGDEKQLSIYAIELELGGKHFKLMSLQNIHSELEEKEMEAWQKLVRVLTHEIMNSVTPISSLAYTVEEELMDYLKKESKNPEFTRDTIEDMHLAVHTIQRRSDGLIRFVNDFRSLTNTPEPRVKMVSVMELFDQVAVLLKYEMDSKGIDFIVNVVPQNLALSIDPELIQQVLINLIKNAIQALEEEENKIIGLSAFQNENKNIIFSIKDNGPGIEEEAQTKIFIPFFTTKKSGSGIGLSLSRQILRQHHASISVKSRLDEGTEFMIRF